MLRAERQEEGMADIRRRLEQNARLSQLARGEVPARDALRARERSFILQHKAAGLSYWEKDLRNPGRRNTADEHDVGADMVLPETERERRYAEAVAEFEAEEDSGEEDEQLPAGAVYDAMRHIKARAPSTEAVRVADLLRRLPAATRAGSIVAALAADERAYARPGGTWSLVEWLPTLDADPAAVDAGLPEAIRFGDPQRKEETEGLNSRGEMLCVVVPRAPGILSEHLGRAKWWQRQNMERSQTLTALGSGLLICDGMGMGKSFSALLCAARHASTFQGPRRIVLVLCPTPLLCASWTDEIRKFTGAPPEAIVTLKSTGDASVANLEALVDRDATRFVVSNYFRGVGNEVAQRLCAKADAFRFVIYDEVHALKSGNYPHFEQLSAAVLAQGGGVVGLTGTPVLSSSAEMAPLCRAVHAVCPGIPVWEGTFWERLEARQRGAARRTQPDYTANVQEEMRRAGVACSFIIKHGPRFLKLPPLTTSLLTY